MSARGLLIRTIVFALCATAAVAIAILLSGHTGATSWRILGTTAAISFFGLLGVPVGVLLERGRKATLAPAAGSVTTVTFLLTLAVIWSDWSAGLGKTWGVLLTLSAGGAQACAVEARRRDDDTPTVARLVAGSMVAGAVLAAMVVGAILSEPGGDGYYRSLGAVAVLDVLLIVVAAVLRRGTGPVRQPYRLLVDGRPAEIAARDFATAAALAIRQAEKDGVEVRRIERA